MEHWWHDSDMGNPLSYEKNLSQCHIVHHLDGGVRVYDMHLHLPYHAIDLLGVQSGVTNHDVAVDRDCENSEE
jgi:hypothetical protein